MSRSRPRVPPRPDRVPDAVAGTASPRPMRLYRDAGTRARGVKDGLGSRPALNASPGRVR